MTSNCLFGALLLLGMIGSVTEAQVEDSQVETIKRATMSMEKQLEETKILLYQDKISINKYQEFEKQTQKMREYYKSVSSTLKTHAVAETLVTAVDLTCTATDVKSWIDCKTKLSTGNIKKILIEKDINCSKDDDCNLSVSDASDLIITSSNSAKLYRVSGLNKPFIAFNKIKNGEISNITLSETLNKPVQLTKGAQEVNEECKNYNYVCDSLIKVEKSSNVTIKNVKMKNAKLFGLALYDNESIYVQDSEVSNSWWFGIWGAANKKLIIKKSQFLNNRSNGVLLGFSNAIEVKITDNLFRGNHHATVFHVCDGGSAPCPGGQIDFINQAKNLIVENNIFENGKMSGEFPEDNNINWVSGIEFEPHSEDIQNVILKNNTFRNNSGSSFFVNAPSESKTATFIADIQFTGNQLCNNKTKENFPAGAAWGKQIKISNNRDLCGGGGGANVNLSANNCTISNKVDLCTVNVKWVTSTDSACVWSDDTLWACEGKSVSKDFQYVGINPINLILRDGRTLDSPELARITVTAQLSSIVKTPVIKSFGTGCDDGNCGWITGENFAEGMTIDLRSTINGEMIKSGIGIVLEHDKKTMSFAIPKELHEKFKNEGFNVYVVDGKNRVWSNPVLLKK